MSAVLKSADGQFQCTPEHAVEIAYMLSNCEAHVQRKPMDLFEVNELIGSYLEGRASVEEIQKILRQWREDDEAMEKEDEAKGKAA